MIVLGEEESDDRAVGRREVCRVVSKGLLERNIDLRKRSYKLKLVNYGDKHTFTKPVVSAGAVGADGADEEVEDELEPPPLPPLPGGGPYAWAATKTGRASTETADVKSMLGKVVLRVVNQRFLLSREREVGEGQGGSENHSRPTYYMRPGVGRVLP